MRERQDFVQRQSRFRLPYKNIERILFEVLASFFAALQITGARDLNLNVLLNRDSKDFHFSGSGFSLQGAKRSGATDLKNDIRRSGPLRRAWKQ
jgi:hypothetical protein